MVQHFGDEVAIVVERYDRVKQGDRWLGIHQEDMCQALGIHPTRKYESDGGPNAAKIVELLRTQSSNPEEDISSFVDAIIFNWLIAGTDAHAKNFGLLPGSNSVV
jgi:serine/threonine-protein kinase HipA